MSKVNKAKEIIKVIILNFLNWIIKKMTKIVDRFKKRKDVLPPPRKIKISMQINKRAIK